MAIDPVTGTLSVVGGILGSRGSKQSGNQTVTTNPWSGATDYISGAETGGGPIYAGDGSPTIRRAVQGPQGEVSWEVVPNEIIGYNETTQTTPGLLPEAQRLYEQGPFTPEFSADTQQAMDLTRQTAGMGTPGEITQSTQALSGMIAGQDPMSQNLQGWASGANVGQNPWLQKAFDQAAGGVQSGVNSMFAKGGRSMSGAHQGLLGDKLGDLATNIYGGAYESDMGRMMDANRLIGGQRMQAINQMPGFADYSYNRSRQNAADLMGVGGMQEQLAQQQHQAPWQNLSQYQGVVQPMAGMGGSTTTPMYSNPWAGAASGAASGAALARQLSTSPGTSSFTPYAPGAAAPGPYSPSDPFAGSAWG